MTQYERNWYEGDSPTALSSTFHSRVTPETDLSIRGLGPEVLKTPV